MIRNKITPRHNWVQCVESIGFNYHSLGSLYWDESTYYSFTMKQIDDIEKATNDVYEMYISAIQHVIDNDLFDKLAIPKEYKEYIINSWNEELPSIYGRFDFVYDGSKIKLLEFNADTPTSLFEASVVQWQWMTDVFKENNVDQFNSIHEKLIEYWKYLYENDYLYKDKLYFSSIKDSIEDLINVEYLRDTAIQANIKTEHIYIQDIGWSENRRAFTDTKEDKILQIFKLYPWEWMFEEEFGKNVIASDDTLFIEPAFKALMSNKGLLAILYELFPNSEYLLPTYFEVGNLTSYAKKPLLSREGANIQLVEDSNIIAETDGTYNDGGYIYQELCKLPDYEGNYPLIGSWVVGQVACGMGIRESSKLITDNQTKFVPHIIKN